MTFACNVFILAGLAGAAGVLLLPVPSAIVSPAFLPRSCQGGSQIAEGMERLRWESGDGEAAPVPACWDRGNPWEPSCGMPWPALSTGGTLQQDQTWGCCGLVGGKT